MSCERSPLVTSDYVGSVLVVAMQRPTALSALNISMHRSLQAALIDANQDAAVRVIVLTGAGCAFSSSGSDMNDRTSRERLIELTVDRQGGEYYEVDLMDSLGKPIVGAIAGYTPLGVAWS